MLAPTCRTARRFCVQLDPRSAEPTFTYGTAVWPACRIQSSPDTSQPVLWKPYAATFGGSMGPHFVKGIGQYFLTCIERAGGAAPVRFIEPRRAAASGGATGFSRPPTKGFFGAWAPGSVSNPR